MLTFWMPNLPTQLWFIRRIQVFLPTLVTLKNLSFIFASVSLMFSALSSSGWMGFAGLLPVLGALIPFLHIYCYMPAFVVNPYLQKHAQELMKPKSTQAT